MRAVNSPFGLASYYADGANMCRNFVMVEEIGWVLDDVEDLEDLRSNIPWFLAKVIYSKPFLPLASQTYQTSLQQMEHNWGVSGNIHHGWTKLAFLMPAPAAVTMVAVAVLPAIQVNAHFILVLLLATQFFYQWRTHPSAYKHVAVVSHRGQGYFKAMPLLSSCHLLLRTILFLRPIIATGVSKRLHTAKQECSLHTRAILQQLGLVTTVSNTPSAALKMIGQEALDIVLPVRDLAHADQDVTVVTIIIAGHTPIRHIQQW
ncbi:hypothetical protein CNMCM6936_008818 [Aspergillus lentulus]|nr:hypothetical protein CNMCM6069_005443 [Aspergillus lentulus]KAF4164765.1 hypothetical protein CNMCM6936_008818 [Aspergillus lentulus]KAF4180570.1 hypothetical protein CNMCM7927_001109 [Aspergillus lentulus]